MLYVSPAAKRRKRESRNGSAVQELTAQRRYPSYPAARACIAVHVASEGSEKVRVLRNELEMKGAEAKLKKLEDAVLLFTPKGMDESGLSADECVTKLARLLNTL